MEKLNTIFPGKVQTRMAEQALSREQVLISKFIGNLTFSPRLRGVDEDAVWKALEKLTELYEDALLVERSKRELAQRQLEALQSRQGEEGEHG